MPFSKKRKIDLIDEKEVYSDIFLSDVDAEIALEISLRKRLVDTLESRIAWATALKEVLQQKARGNATPETVRGAALDALREIEAPSECLLCHDPPPPFPPKPTLSVCPPPRRPLFLTNANTTSKPSFLFIRSSTFDIPLEGRNNSENGHEGTTTYLLKCPSCSKTSFIALQGLLNHARLVHNLEWGTHEECISACAVPDNDLDLTSGTEVGLGPTGILPGLRNIFQMAVGGRSTRADCTIVGTGDDPPSAKTFPCIPPNPLNESLGLHDESPALAMFLGKDPIRRQIKITGEEGEVDIEGFNHRMISTRRWRMPFAHRHINLPFLESEPQNVKGKSNIEHSNVEDIALMGNQTADSTNSRFHLVSRIIITDRSLWIRPGERTLEYRKYTHKWMISIDSPSYAHHITSILNSVQVTPVDLDDPIPVPPPKTTPPFVVIGLANKGFLAKVTLTFSGLHSQVGPSSSEQTFVFEHWVDLYPLKESHIIKGQDQVVDIELGKDTVIRPPRRDYPPIDSKSLWDQSFEAARASVSPKSDHVDLPTEKHEERLAEIVKRFPMTIEDFKGKRNKLPKVPYMLANSVQHLLTFVTGRRKAIEWGRSRAIHEAYTQSLAESFHPNLPALTVGDVYLWLLENGHFPRPSHFPIRTLSQDAAKTFNDSQTNEDAELIWCRFCGLDIRLHGSSSKKEEDNTTPTQDIDGKVKSQGVFVSNCPVVAPGLQITKLPRVDIKRFVLPDQAVARGVGIIFDRKTLLSAADPSMVQYIHELTKQWELKTFHSITSNRLHQIESLSPVAISLSKFGNRDQVETNLAPHALLSLLTKQLICNLVNCGLQVSNGDRAKALSPAFLREGKTSRNQVAGIRMLTPTHILSGILTRGLGRDEKRHPVDPYLLLGLSRVGIAVDNDEGLDNRRTVTKI